MANEVAPNPITTSFIPEAWDAARTETQYNKALDANYIKLSPQNVPITFLNSLTIPTPASINDSTLATTTAWVRSFFNSLLSQTLVWDLLQTYSGILTNAINPSGASGTLQIGHGATNNNVEIASVANRSVVLHLGDGDNSSGGIHIGNGTNSANNVQILNGTGSTGTITLGSSGSTINLNCPLTPAYTLPITNTNAIGYLAPVTFVQNAVNSTAPGVRYVSLTPGEWFLTASISTYDDGGSHNISFNNGFARNGAWQFSTGQPLKPWGLTVSRTLTVTANLNYYVNVRNDTAGNLWFGEVRAIRIG